MALRFLYPVLPELENRKKVTMMSFRKWLLTFFPPSSLFKNESQDFASLILALFRIKWKATVAPTKIEEGKMYRGDDHPIKDGWTVSYTGQFGPDYADKRR